MIHNHKRPHRVPLVSQELDSEPTVGSETKQMEIVGSDSGHSDLIMVQLKLWCF